MSKSELLHFTQLWKSLFPAPEPPGCVWRMLQHEADSAVTLEFPQGTGQWGSPKSEELQGTASSPLVSMGYAPKPGTSIPKHLSDGDQHQCLT